MPSAKCTGLRYPRGPTNSGRTPHLALLHHEHTVDVAEELQLVRHEHARPAAQLLLEAPVEERGADVGVEGGQRVVQQVDVRLAVHRARDADALLLATTEVDALHTNASSATTATIRHVEASTWTSRLQHSKIKSSSVNAEQTFSPISVSSPAANCWKSVVKHV
jgi:hypothetical protein